MLYSFGQNRVPDGGSGEAQGRNVCHKKVEIAIDRGRVEIDTSFSSKRLALLISEQLIADRLRANQSTRH